MRRQKNKLRYSKPNWTNIAYNMNDNKENNQIKVRPKLIISKHLMKKRKQGQNLDFKMKRKKVMIAIIN